MAVESERSPYPDGTPGGPKAAQDDVPTSLTRRSASEKNMRELPRSTVKSQGHTPFVSQLPKPSHAAQGASGPPSTTNSAISSREPSPSRSSQRPRNSTSTSRVSSRSRKRNPDRSPDRSAATSPSPGPGKPTQTNKPLVLSPPPNVEPSSDAPSPDKSNMPLWAGSRRSEQELHQPNTSSKRTQVMGDEYVTKPDRSAPRPVNRSVNGSSSALETVQEASDQSTPSNDTILLQPAAEDDKLEKIDEDGTPKTSRHHTESGSDSGGNKSSEQLDENRRRPSFASKASNAIIPKRSSTSLSGAPRAKPTDGSVRNMIVETETVSSIPQVSLGVGTGDRGSSGRIDPGSLRMKPSTETIRPKKEKKRARKPAALTSGAASSKADIFEAKVASAVDEADVSDSDETFVYESNPQEQPPARQGRYHSRTPSATSMASQVDQLAGRSRAAMREGNHSVTGKRSMKFTNNPYNSSVDGDADEIPRSHPRIDGNGTHTPRHHIGRHGRQNMYPSLFDNESPCPQSQGHKSPRHFIGSGYRQARLPGSRNSQNYRTINSYKKAGEVYGYDFDAEGADDERTPLVGSPRQTRSRGGRRPNSASLRQMEYMQQRHRSFLSRYGACVLISLLFFLLVGGGTSFIVSITKPLLDVQVLDIQNVLASEQELMLDLNVQAINPNLFPVVIDDIDVNIFAKSRFVGTESFWRDHGSDLARFGRSERRKRAEITRTARCADGIGCKDDGLLDQQAQPGGGVDKGTDPIPSDPAGDQQTMLIGRVFRLDSALTFEASPWNHEPSASKGQIRLARPGNTTEKGGTERWERVLQHPFELIVAGVVQYQLPLSSRFHSSSISSSIKVTPNGDDENAPKKNETVSISMTKPFRRSSPSTPPSTAVLEGETLKAIRALITMTRRAFVA
ncbi:vacuolar segregation subunit 7-domain-containing protein [Aspergillus aurantiobrunneus]